jgi:hypothetical protein
MKLFFIGFNKTGTSTYFHIFKNLIKSTHDTIWTKKSHILENNMLDAYFKYDCYSDGEECNFEKLDLHFKDGLFILNTRDLQGWIYSRIKHIYRNYPTKANGDMALEWHKYDDKVEVIKLWILRRNNYYKKVINYFENKKNFIMVDINSENLKQDLSNFTNIKIETIVKSNVREKELPIVINFKKDIIKTFEALEIKKEDYTSIGVIDYI